MEKQEFLDKLSAVHNVANKLPDDVNIASAYIFGVDEFEPYIHLYSGIEEAAKLAGQEITQNKRSDGQLELSFLSEGVMVIQVVERSRKL